jgi:uncharacterized protein YlxW (UPF0749 family)
MSCSTAVRHSGSRASCRWAADGSARKQALAASKAIQTYMVYVNVYGLGWKVTDDGTVTLPGYSGTVDLHYAKPVR